VIAEKILMVWNTIVFAMMSVVSSTGSIDIQESNANPDNVPDLYCPGCLTEFGVRIPAVFVPPRESEDTSEYPVCCPVAGLVQKTDAALCHGGPYSHAIGSDGRTWKYLGETIGFVASEYITANGTQLSRTRRYLRRKLNTWKLAMASPPTMFLNDDAPSHVMVKEEFDWSRLE
jgi:hypothetical protein